MTNATMNHLKQSIYRCICERTAQRNQKNVTSTTMHQLKYALYRCILEQDLSKVCEFSIKSCIRLRKVEDDWD